MRDLALCSASLWMSRSFYVHSMSSKSGLAYIGAANDLERRFTSTDKKLELIHAEIRREDPSLRSG